MMERDSGCSALSTTTLLKIPGYVAVQTWKRRPDPCNLVMRKKSRSFCTTIAVMLHDQGQRKPRQIVHVRVNGGEVNVFWRKA